MSGLALSQTRKTEDNRIAKLLAALGLLAAFALLFQQPVNAIQPQEKDKTGQREPAVTPEKAPDIDSNPPLPPAGDAKQQLAARIPVPNPDRAIFAGRRDSKGPILGTGIVDYEEIASEKKNSDEYQAWHEIVLHARQFMEAELQEFARRDLTWDDLVGTGPQPRVYRLNLVRFEGKLTRVRRLPGTKSLQEEGTPEIYEGQLIPVDGPPNEIVSIVFTELPSALAGLKQRPMNQWLDVNDDAVAAGYFFKVKQDPPQLDKVPVLIGKSVTLVKDAKEVPGSVNSTVAAEKNNPLALDTNLQVFKGIKEETRIARGDVNWQEAVSWNRVLLHARRFSPEELEKNARTDIKFADLFDEVRKDYKLQLVRFEGRLLMVRKMEPSQKLRAAGLDAAYEGWLVPQDEPRGNPVCIVFTDLPEGMEMGRVNKWVSFAGYSFKLMNYESGEIRPDDPTRHVIKRAPLLLGRTIVPQLDPDRPSTLSWSTFVWAAVGAISLMLGIAGGLTWWFRRGDIRAKEEITAHRSRNPFEGQ